ncbi:MAG: DMT family transporter [Bacteroidales bacterium]
MLKHFFKTAPSTPMSQITKGHVAILVANIIFGVNVVISKSLMPEYITPLSLTFMRMIGAALIFWFVSLFIKKEKIDRKDFGMIFLASMLGVLINQFFYIKGLSMTSPIEASIVITFTPILTMLMSAMYLKEPITGKKTIGVLLGASGAILLILTSQIGQLGNGSMWGNIFCIFSGISYAAYLTFFKKIICKYSPITLMKWMFLSASIISLPFSFPELRGVNYAAIPGLIYLRIAFVVVAATFFTYILIPIAQKSLRPTTLSMYNYTQPVVASLVALSLGLDTFGYTKIASAILVFLGVYIVTQSKSRAQIDLEKMQKINNKGDQNYCQTK